DVIVVQAGIRHLHTGGADDVGNGQLRGNNVRDDHVVGGRDAGVADYDREGVARAAGRGRLHGRVACRIVVREILLDRQRRIFNDLHVVAVENGGGHLVAADVGRVVDQPRVDVGPHAVAHGQSHAPSCAQARSPPADVVVVQDGIGHLHTVGPDN